MDVWNFIGVWRWFICIRLLELLTFRKGNPERQLSNCSIAFETWNLLEYKKCRKKHCFRILPQKEREEEIWEFQNDNYSCIEQHLLTNNQSCRTTKSSITLCFYQIKCSISIYEYSKLKRHQIMILFKAKLVKKFPWKVHQIAHNYLQFIYRKMISVLLELILSCFELFEHCNQNALEWFGFPSAPFLETIEIRMTSHLQDELLFYLHPNLFSLVGHQSQDILSSDSWFSLEWS